MKIKFIPAKAHPKEAGSYLFKSCSGNISLVEVDVCHSYFGPWLGIVDFGGRNVEAFHVWQFSEKVEFE